MRKRTRFKLTIVAGLMFFGLATLSVFKGTENIAITSIAGIMTILSVYIWGETNRASKQ